MKQLLSITVLLLTLNAFSQVGIGTASPAASAALEVASTTKGFLPPRMTYAQKTAISTPATGLTIWCSNCGSSGELQVYNGTTWTNITGSAALASVPDAPTIGVATSGNAQVSVAFTAPASNGGSIITSYTVTASPGGAVATGATSPLTVTGLTNGTPYTFTVKATNAVGNSVASAVSAAVTPATVPGAPTSPVATPGNTQASVAFTAPASNGGSTITSYTVTASGGINATGATSPLTVTGLTNGTSYTFTVHATNAVGNSVASAVSVAVTPATVPGAPTSPVATRGNTQASVAFAAPASNGGSTITSYTVTASPGGAVATGTASPLTVTGLTNGTSYTFTVRATNAVGNSVASVVSAAVTPYTLPTITSTAVSSITINSASSGGNVTSDGGNTITSRGICWGIVTSPTTALPTKTVAGGTTGSFSSSISGLSAGTTYYLRAYATNGAGTAYGNQITLSTPTVALGSTFTNHYNGVVSGSYTGTGTTVTHSTGETFNNFTSIVCENSLISAGNTSCPSSVTGASGTVYPLILINGQCWMTRNLNEIPSNFSSYTTTSWLATSPPDNGYWGYFNTSNLTGTAGWGSVEPSNEGILYQWSAAMNASTTERAQGSCPSGYHVPSDCEWSFLEHGLGLSLSSNGGTGWRETVNSNLVNKLLNQGTGANNSSGFNALLSGNRRLVGSFLNRGNGASWWTSTTNTPALAYYRGINKDEVTEGLNRYSYGTSFGFSVRCLKN